ncbi:hypothetical protein [Gordonia sp. OPL2]|uniref:hypothetical protein n=1 Tax=Gordonia sp. OPL2 TaxID=2486274 RepID=UPI0021CCA387|nr:hypothetical protein [Gordonia sp. OPL2]
MSSSSRVPGAARRVCLPIGVLVALATVAACTGSTPTDDVTPTSVPTSATVTVPAGQPARSSPGTALTFGQSAVLPANAFAANGSPAMFTVTGITPAEGVPEDTAQGGTPYFLYVTVTSLASRPAPAPRVVGLSGSADGRTPALTMSPTPGLTACPEATPPERMRRGQSYTACLVSVADQGQRLQQVIYWADTTDDPALDYKSTPVAWSLPGPASTPAAPNTPAG